MKNPFIFILLLATLAHCSDMPAKSIATSPQTHGDQLKIQIISLRDQHSNDLKIKLSFTMGLTGEQKIVLPRHWAGQLDLFEGITELKANSNHTAIVNTKRPYFKIVTAPKHQEVEIEYKLHQYWSGSMVAGRRYYRPILKNSHFQFIGEAALILPDWNFDQKNHVTLSFKGFPKDWNLAHSFAEQKKTHKQALSLNDLKYAVFLGGDFRILERNIKGKSIHVALRGQWGFSDDDFADLAQKTMAMERDFWNDHKFPYYLITLSPTAGNCCHYAGTALTQTVSLFATQKLSLTRDIKHLLTHEMFHTWNGRIIKRQHPEELVFWFSEGFTNYFTRELNLKAGLISKKTYVKDYNQVLRDYYTSPARNMSNQNILGEFWSNQNIYNLPYVKGEILAHNWNVLLKQHHPKLDLKVVMQDLLKMSKRYGKKISADVIDEIFSKYIPGGIKQELDLYVNQGRLIKPYAKKILGCASLMNQSVKAEFDLDSNNHWGSSSRYQKGAKVSVPQYDARGCE